MAPKPKRGPKKPGKSGTSLNKTLLKQPPTLFDRMKYNITRFMINSLRLVTPPSSETNLMKLPMAYQASAKTKKDRYPELWIKRTLFGYCHLQLLTGFEHTKFFVLVPSVYHHGYSSLPKTNVILKDYKLPSQRLRPKRIEWRRRWLAAPLPRNSLGRDLCAEPPWRAEKT